MLNIRAKPVVLYLLQIEGVALAHDILQLLRIRLQARCDLEKFTQCVAQIGQTESWLLLEELVEPLQGFDMLLVALTFLAHSSLLGVVTRLVFPMFTTGFIFAHNHSPFVFIRYGEQYRT